MRTQRVILLALAITPLFAETLSQGDRDFALSHLHATRKLFLDAMAGLSEAQWKFKPAPDRWSVAECAEHIIMTEDFLYQTVLDKVLKSPSSPPKTPPTREQDEAVLQMVTDRSKKFTAPEALRPSSQRSTPDTSIQAFKQRRDRTIAFVRQTQEDLRSHSHGNRDGYQWFLFLSGHSQRHLAQIDEVKADPNYPKK